MSEQECAEMAFSVSIDDAKNEMETMSETPAKPTMQDLNQNPDYKMTVPLRIIGLILAILIACRGRPIEAVLQFLMIGTVPVSDHLCGVGFLMIWHALALTVYSSQSAVSFYNKYHLVGRFALESNNTSALFNDTVFTPELVPSDYFYPIVLVSLLGAILLMLHATLTNILVRRITAEALSGKKATYVIHDAGVVFGAAFSMSAFQMISITEQGVWSDIFRVLGSVEFFTMAAYLSGYGNQILQLFHCFYLLAVGSFLLFSYSALESKSLLLDAFTTIMSAPSLDGVRNFLDFLSYAGICAAVIFWCLRISWNYAYLVFFVVRRRVGENVSMRDSLHVKTVQRVGGILLSALILYFAEGIEKAAALVGLLTLLPSVNNHFGLLVITIVWHAWLIFTGYVKVHLLNSAVYSWYEAFTISCIYASLFYACLIRILGSHDSATKKLEEMDQKIRKFYGSPLFRGIIVYTTICAIVFLIRKGDIFGSKVDPYICGAAMAETVFSLGYIKPVMPMVAVHMVYLLVQAFIVNYTFYMVAKLMLYGCIGVSSCAISLLMEIFFWFFLRPALVYIFWMNNKFGGKVEIPT